MEISSGIKPINLNFNNKKYKKIFLVQKTTSNQLFDLFKTSRIEKIYLEQKSIFRTEEPIFRTINQHPDWIIQ